MIVNYVAVVAKDFVPVGMAEHEAIGKVRKAAVDSINTVTVAVLTNTTDLERGDLIYGAGCCQTKPSSLVIAFHSFNRRHPVFGMLRDRGGLQAVRYFRPRGRSN